MSLLLKGVSRLSELQIDADKDCGSMGLSNLKEVVTGMAVGDIIFHDGARIEKISPGAFSSELITRGSGHNPYYGWVA